MPGVAECELAGSLRRYAETAKDIDLVLATDDPSSVTEGFAAQDWVAEVEARGETKVTCIAHDGTRVELRMIEPGLFGNLLQHLTGSKHHNVALREAAVKAGLKVSEYGIEELATGEVMRTGDEAEVYQRLGMDWVPPELRENRGEIEAARAHALPDLVTLDQIRGDLHCAHGLERWKVDARGDGRGRPGEGLQLPERDRPLARGRLRHGVGRRQVTAADRAGADAGVDVARVHAAGRR